MGGCAIIVGRMFVGVWKGGLGNCCKVKVKGGAVFVFPDFSRGYGVFSVPGFCPLRRAVGNCGVQ